MKPFTLPAPMYDPRTMPGSSLCREGSGCTYCDNIHKEAKNNAS